MPITYNKPSRYDYVSRKLFDKQIDRWTRKVASLKEDIRELEKKLFRLETGQTTMLDFVNAMPRDNREERPQSDGDSTDPHYPLCLCDSCSTAGR